MKTMNNEINIVGDNVNYMTFSGRVEELDGDYMVVTKEVHRLDDKGFPVCENYGNKMIFRIRSVQFLYGQNDRFMKSDFMAIGGICGKKVMVTFVEANYPRLVEIFPQSV